MQQNLTERASFGVEPLHSVLRAGFVQGTLTVWVSQIDSCFSRYLQRHGTFACRDPSANVDVEHELVEMPTVEVLSLMKKGAAILPKSVPMQVLTYDGYPVCTNFPLRLLTAAGGIWTTAPDSSSISRPPNLARDAPLSTSAYDESLASASHWPKHLLIPGNLNTRRAAEFHRLALNNNIHRPADETQAHPSRKTLTQLLEDEPLSAIELLPFSLTAAGEDALDILETAIHTFNRRRPDLSMHFLESGRTYQLPESKGIVQAIGYRADIVAKLVSLAAHIVLHKNLPLIKTYAKELPPMIVMVLPPTQKPTFALGQLIQMYDHPRNIQIPFILAADQGDDSSLLKTLIHEFAHMLELEILPKAAKKGDLRATGLHQQWQEFLTYLKEISEDLPVYTGPPEGDDEDFRSLPTAGLQKKYNKAVSLARSKTRAQSARASDELDAFLIDNAPLNQTIAETNHYANYNEIEFITILMEAFTTNHLQPHPLQLHHGWYAGGQPGRGWHRLMSSSQGLRTMDQMITQGTGIKTNLHGFFADVAHDVDRSDPRDLTEALSKIEITRKGGGKGFDTYVDGLGHWAARRHDVEHMVLGAREANPLFNLLVLLISMALSHFYQLFQRPVPVDERRRIRN
jgi:hypothetical protein